MCGYDFVIFDGFVMLFFFGSCKLFDDIDVLVVVLLINFDINDSLEEILVGFGCVECKFVGVVLDEFMLVVDVC